MNLPEKVRVVEVLCSSLEEVQHASGAIFGAGNVSASLAPGIGKKEGELWSVRLEEFSNVCDGVVANFGKKLGVGEGFMIKKNSGVSRRVASIQLSQAFVLILTEKWRLLPGVAS